MSKSSLKQSYSMNNRLKSADKFGYQPQNKNQLAAWEYAAKLKAAKKAAKHAKKEK
jgi:hypothetical protein